MGCNIQGSIYGRRDHNQAEVDRNHSEPEVLNIYVQKTKVLSFMYNRAFLLWLYITVFLLFGAGKPKREWETRICVISLLK